MDVVAQYLLQLNKDKQLWRRAVAILTVLSLVVTLVTVWNLRMTGITVANSASCGAEEHKHSAECMQGSTLVCGKQEHTHATGCYSNPQSDIESSSDWHKMFDEYPYTGDLRRDLVGVAKTQVGYTESKLNFETKEDQTQHGYTRYGAWYGAPYNDWSAMFVSFCLHFAGADTNEFPISSGAATMAALWKKQGRFSYAEQQYAPKSGDIVFFNNNTAGIVTEVYKATFYVIRGDMQDAVRAVIMSLADASIMGWGITGEKTDVYDKLPDSVVSGGDVLDISNGPSVHIFEGGRKETSPTRGYSLRLTRSTIDLLQYLTGNDGNYFFTLLDNNNTPLSTDEYGNFIVQANAKYKLTVSFTSPQGFSPGTYQYQIPNGLLVDGGEGSFVLTDKTNVGDWVVTDTGLITLVFNENMNSRTDITISLTLGINFPEQNEPIDFDGKISVTVQKPPPQQDPTEIYKWGLQGDATNGEDPTKLYWSVQIIGNKDSSIPGNILSDRILTGEWSKTHSYTASDIAGGLTFGVSEPDPVTGEFKDWHSWHVSPDDPHLIWTENEWSYKMPEKATCQWCGEVILGNENWIYTVNYTSTPDPSASAGTYGYENEASIDGKTGYAWADFAHGEVLGEISKGGSFVSDAGGGNFIWELQAMIPGLAQGQKADYNWYIMDYMYLLDKNLQRAGYIENNAGNVLVTAYYKGATVQVPEIHDATASDQFAWHNAWTAYNEGVGYGQEITLLCRCNCNAENCQFWNGYCENYWVEDEHGTGTTNGFCQCWTVDENVTFTFAYMTEALELIEEYGGLGYSVQNIAELYYKPIPSANVGALVSSTNATAGIPGLFKKELTQDFDGYTAHYRITVNEAKAVLTNGEPLTIHDVMSDTLAYANGSIVVAAEDVDGNVTTLQYGTHYIVTYDKSGNHTDSNGKKVHVLDIVILQPQPVMYILDYDTTLIMPDQFTGGVKYSNSASITLWGQDITDVGVEKVYADVNISAKTYTVEMFKTCAQTKTPLKGATFGLYNSQGGLISTEETDENGKLAFSTNINEGVVLREHVLYYLQENIPPKGYLLDDTKYWFCFCSSTEDSCETCDEILADREALRIPFDQIGIVDAVNQPADFELPTTGGAGRHVYVLFGLILVFSPFVYIIRLRCKNGRRLNR